MVLTCSVPSILSLGLAQLTTPPPGRGRCIPFCLGFHSSTVAWQEYRLICEGLGRTPDQGIDAASFFKLVNEEWQIRSMHPT